MPNDNGKATEVSPKVEKPFAPLAGRVLPETPAGCEWDETSVGPWRFAILVAKNIAGISQIAKSEAKAVALFNRAWRIAVPAAIDARSVKKDAMNSEWAAKVQQEILDFDPAAIRTRAARTPPTVEIPKDKKSFTVDELRAMFGDRITLVQK